MAGIAGLAAAFVAGIVSFVSPCVLPMVPGYISFMTGIAPTRPEGGRTTLSAVIVPGLLFVAGLSVVFVALGATASALGALLVPYKALLSRVAGAFIVAMGVFMLGVLKIPFLYRDTRLDPGRARSFGRGGALVLGMAFAFGWTPCVGPVLASILVLAGSSASVGRGAALLLAYALGLGLPFLGVGVLFGRLRGAVGWLSRHSMAVDRTAGTLLIALGVLMLTGMLPLVASFFLRRFPFLAG